MRLTSIAHLSPELRRRVRQHAGLGSGSRVPIELVGGELAPELVGLRSTGRRASSLRVRVGQQWVERHAKGLFGGMV